MFLRITVLRYCFYLIIFSVGLKYLTAQIFRTVFFVAMVGLSELTNGKTEVMNIWKSYMWTVMWRIIWKKIIEVIDATFAVAKRKLEKNSDYGQSLRKSNANFHLECFCQVDMFLNLTPDTLSMMLLKSTSNTFLRWISNTNTVGELELSPIIVEKRMPDARAWKEILLIIILKKIYIA